MKKHILILISFYLQFSYLESQNLCNDYLLLNGMEKLNSFGIDTTFNWWAITEPFNEQYRIIINGNESDVYSKISNPVFSPDGLRWAYFAYSNINNFLVTNDTIINITNGKGINILFSGNSQRYLYTYIEGNEMKLVLNDNVYSIINGTNQIAIDYYGENIAYVISKVNRNYIYKNNIEVAYFDKIKLVGFDDKGKVLYIAFTGNGWQLYKDNKAISEIYADITEFKINLLGNIYAMIVKNFSNKYQVILYSDEYYEPLIGTPYTKANNLVLHPYLSLYAYKSSIDLKNYIIYNNSEYSSGKISGSPSFSSDGEDLYFLGCDFDCFINLNGRRFNIDNNIDVDMPISVANGGKSYAYTTNYGLMVKKINSKDLYSGMMVDFTIPPRYNRKNNRYETLGVIGNKLYLLTCIPPK